MSTAHSSTEPDVAREVVAEIERLPTTTTQAQLELGSVENVA